MSAPGAHLAIAQVVARNIAPLAGIVFFGWNAQNVLLLYFLDTLLALGVLFAGLLRYFSPPIEGDGWAARVNSEVGVVAGGAFLAAAFSVPLGVPLIFMLGGSFDWNALLGDASVQIGLAWQVAAALGSYLELYRALRTATPDELRLKRRFALVLLRWMALVFVAYFGVGFVFGRYSALVFVALYGAVSIWAEIAPDHFLRMVPAGANIEQPQPTSVARRARRKR